jgi:outer membrane receptor protein involved in Fe transport
VTPADYGEFCITAPTDSRLPGGGGNQICGLYDLRPEKFGQVDDVITLASHFGKQTEVYNGGEVSINARLGQGTLAFGGVSFGQTVTDNCAVLVDSPQKLYCRNENPSLQVKLAGSYALPWWGLQASAVFQNFDGVSRQANFVATNAQIRPSLGRNLGACGNNVVCNATVLVDLMEPNAVREPRQSQLDVRLSTIIRLARYRLEPRFDIYNVLNANDVQSMVTRYGATWLNASSILPGRTFKFGFRAEF